MKNKLNVFKAGLLLAAVVVAFPAAAAHADTLYRQLDLGARGADVSSLQTYLSQDSSIYPEGLVTGYFGNLSFRAVGRFQTQNGIPSVGRVGPVTLVALNAKMNGGGTVGSYRTAPTIGPVNVSVSTNVANVSWNTSSNAAAVVYYSTAPISMTEATDVTTVSIGGMSMLVHQDLRTSHNATLSGLMANTMYYYVVYVKDGNGNEAVTLPGTFRTTN